MTERVIVPREVAQNWNEDLAHENGNYMNVCTSCEAHFTGLKGRRTCRVCASPNAGEVTEEELKAADRAYAVAFNEQMNHLTGTMPPADAIASASLEGLRAALSSLGIKVK